MRWRITSLAVALVACSGPDPIRVAGLTVDLVTPAEVDPLAGVDTLIIRVLGPTGQELLRAEGDADSGVPLPLITTFGQVEVEVAGLGSGSIRSLGRSGPVEIAPDDELAVDVLFLPINQAVQLTWAPSTNRVGHSTFLASDGRVLLLGGRVPSTSDVRRDSEWWHPRLGFDGLGPNLSERATGSAAVLLSDRTLLLAGGESTSGPSDQVIALTADGTATSALDPLPTPQATPCIAAHPTLGAVVFAGDDIAVYEPTRLRGVDADVGLDGVEACATAGGRIVFVGDDDTGWGVLDVVDATWPVDFAGSVEPIDGVPALVGPMAVELDYGEVLVAGGFGLAASDATRVVDPATATAAPAATLGTPRVHGNGARWREGAIVFGGGYADEIRGTPVRSIEIFHPTRGSLLTVPTDVRGGTMTVLPGGTVLLTGGVDGDLQPAGAWAVMPYIGDDS